MPLSESSILLLGVEVWARQVARVQAEIGQRKLWVIWVQSELLKHRVLIVDSKFLGTLKYWKKVWKMVRLRARRGFFGTCFPWQGHCIKTYESAIPSLRCKMVRIVRACRTPLRDRWRRMTDFRVKFRHCKVLWPDRWGDCLKGKRNLSSSLLRFDLLMFYPLLTRFS